LVRLPGFVVARYFLGTRVLCGHEYAAIKFGCVIGALMEKEAIWTSRLHAGKVSRELKQHWRIVPWSHHASQTRSLILRIDRLAVIELVTANYDYQ
jgi:hypothetical protein